MMLKIQLGQIYLFFLVILLFSCQGKKEEVLDYIPHTVKIERFDQAFEALSSNNILLQDSLWKEQYGPFYADFIPGMLGIESTYPQRLIDLKQVAESPDFIAVRTAVRQTFPDLRKEEIELGHALGKLTAYIPEAKLPERYISFFSGFGVQIPIGERYIGIGLDLFLGAESAFYPALQAQIPRYLSRRFTREQIVPRVVEGILSEVIPTTFDPSDRLLEYMVERGKHLYLLEKVVPEVADSILMGYTAAQMEWAERHEKMIWDWFVHQELLFETDYMKFHKHLNDGPFTSELGENNESAPKLAVFLGWKMIQKFHQLHPELTMKELMEMKDAHAVLKGARYKGQSH
jgi:hypothetical protein